MSLGFLPLYDLSSTIAIPCCSGLEEREDPEEDSRRICDSSPTRKCESSAGRRPTGRRISKKNSHRSKSTQHAVRTETDLDSLETPHIEIAANTAGEIVCEPVGASETSLVPADMSDHDIYFLLGQTSLILNASQCDGYRKNSVCSISSISDTEDCEDQPELTTTSDVNPIVPDLFPKMDIEDDEQFMKFNKLPLTPAYVAKQ